MAVGAVGGHGALVCALDDGAEDFEVEVVDGVVAHGGEG